MAYSVSKINRQINKCDSLSNKLDTQCGSLLNMLKDHFKEGDFSDKELDDMSIFDQAGDRLVICLETQDNNFNISVYPLVEYIKQKGYISREDFFNESI